MTERRQRRALSRLVLLGDAVLVGVAMALAAGLHAALLDSTSLVQGLPSPSRFAFLAYLVLPLFVAMIAAFGLHRVFDRPPARVELVVGLFKLHVTVFIGFVLILFLSQGVVNRSLVGLFFSSTFVLLYAERAAIGAWQDFQHRSGQGRQNILLVGTPSGDMQTFVNVAGAQHLPPSFFGILTPENGDGSDAVSLRPEGIAPFQGTVADLDSVLHNQSIDQVFFFPPFRRPADLPEAMRLTDMLGVPARFPVESAAETQAPPSLITVFDHPVISYETVRTRPEALAVKHLFDVFAAALGLVLLSPLLLGVCVAILVTSGRPIFFIQERAGFNGRIFRMFKFRTMAKDAEARKGEVLDQNELDGPAFKLTDDPRVTRLGAFLRASSIDELPQLLNVVRGSMSLVGPRPLPVEEQKQIRGWHRRRLAMKPGITCLWQVGGRSDLGFEEWMRLDLEYVDRWSLGLDARILAKTLPAVLSRTGAR